MEKSYEELIKFDSFKKRYEYLKLSAFVGDDTFGDERLLNQIFYRTKEWADVRKQIMMRDNGCDLGMEGYDIYGRILIHHINPITKHDIINRSSKLFDPNNLISVSHSTHNAIHYGVAYDDPNEIVNRSLNDTKLW